jgi:pimeloyl-ACP methyl ester carboxylesterase
MMAVWKLKATRSNPSGSAEDPREQKVPPLSQNHILRPDGSKLKVVSYGRKDGPLIVLTHGWGCNHHEWEFLKRELAGTFHLLVWDEPGLGDSTRPANRDFSLENLARDLEAVIATAGPRRPLVVGHSIGGMIALTYCRLFADTLTERVAGLVLTHTTYKNPVETMKGAAFYRPLQAPVLKPLMYLTIALSPLFWLSNWMSYLNGSAHLSASRNSFAGGETWAELDFAARFQAKASPAVVARGMLAMMEFDETTTLPGIDVPALVIAGDLDTTTMPHASERIRSDIPNARLQMLAPARHLGLIEHHAQYAQMVRQFADTPEVASAMLLPGHSPLSV